MTRISKNPEERKQELIDTAEQLFARNGYGKTLVSDIVKEIGVAQGTFYYYFKTKDEIMAAILDKKWNEVAVDIKSSINKNSATAKDKLANFIVYLLMPDLSGEKKIKYRMFQDPEILNLFHSQLDESRVLHLMPMIQQIVMEGIETQEFRSLVNTKEIVSILFYGINSYLHICTPLLKEPASILNIVGAMEELLERILGVDQGQLNLVNKIILRQQSK